MSQDFYRSIRPKYHFSPKKGWINDPNGLTYSNGKYHLFAQHEPNKTVWGPMHWLHATSENLLDWNEIGIALAPDKKLGMVFSGSAVIDEGNTSGLGKTYSPMVTIFTHHGDKEQQSIAFSDDHIKFESYPGNPVLPSKGDKDFRDPKVIRNPLRDCWTMVLAVGGIVEFYSSYNLIDWKRDGEFGRFENPQGYIFECPDLFPLISPSGHNVWVLTASFIMPRETGGSRTIYYLGEFDGYAFKAFNPSEPPLLLDEGYDNYAAVTFSGASTKTQVGWATSWTYADKLPTKDYRGLMTYARNLSLASTDRGLRLVSQPITPEHTLIDIQRNDRVSTANLDKECFHLQVTSNEPFLLEIGNESGEKFYCGLNNNNRFFTDRTQAGSYEFSSIFSKGLYAFTESGRCLRGKVQLDIFFDHCIFELFGDAGVYVNTTLAFPSKPYTYAKLSGKADLRVGQF